MSSTWPPSTGITTPVTNDDTGLTSIQIQLAISSAAPMRPSGTCDDSQR